MANPQNLKPKPFTKDNQPKNRGSRKGVPNRSTTLRKWLFDPVDIVNPGTLKKEKGTAEDEIMLALLRRARNGNIQAIKEILDTVYGKQSNVNFNLNPEELQNLTDEELDSLITKANR